MQRQNPNLNLVRARSVLRTRLYGEPTVVMAVITVMATAIGGGAIDALAENSDHVFAVVCLSGAACTLLWSLVWAWVVLGGDE